MKIDVKKITKAWYSPREEFDDEYISELAQSIDQDGQWDPIMVRPNAGKYELVAGECRLKAIKKLKRSEIEATILDIDEEEAVALALKTNMFRRNLAEMEEGKAIKKMMDKFSLSQVVIAKQLGRSESFVSGRLSLVLDVGKEVKQALRKNEITLTHAVIMSQLPKVKQAEFLDLVIENKWTSDQTRVELARFQNDTIFTIGYSGKNFDQFASILKKNRIQVLVDVRDSTASMRKPEFSGKVLERELGRLNIEYVHAQEYGVPQPYRDPYTEGAINFDCFRSLYIYHVDTGPQELAEKIKNEGRSVLMCSEEFVNPKGSQNHYCHRGILAELLLTTGLFVKQVDL